MATETAPVSQSGIPQIDKELNSFDKKSFPSASCSLGWLGTAVSPFCSEVSSRMQQFAPRFIVKVLISQEHALKKLSLLGTLQSFLRVVDRCEQKPSIVNFCDAGRATECRQKLGLSTVLIDQLGQGSIFHALSWCFHKSKCPGWSAGAAEILAAGEDIDESEMFKRTLSLFYKSKLALFLFWVPKICLQLSPLKETALTALSGPTLARFDLSLNTALSTSSSGFQENRTSPALELTSIVLLQKLLSWRFFDGCGALSFVVTEHSHFDKSLYWSRKGRIMFATPFQYRPSVHRVAVYLAITAAAHQVTSFYSFTSLDFCFVCSRSAVM